MHPARPHLRPLGKGFHIIQSTIAIGSGGVFGKEAGARGTQTHLDFLPERHTDFIFAVLTEEFGLAGALFLAVVYILLIFAAFSPLVPRPVFAPPRRRTDADLLHLRVRKHGHGERNPPRCRGSAALRQLRGGTALVTLCLGVGMLMSIQRHRRRVGYLNPRASCCARPNRNERHAPVAMFRRAWLLLAPFWLALSFSALRCCPDSRPDAGSLRAFRPQAPVPVGTDGAFQSSTANPEAGRGDEPGRRTPHRARSHNVDKAVCAADPLPGSASQFREKGVASWYGKMFHGRKTSSGDTCDMYAMTAAHPSLPIPSYVRVTNLNNGRSAVVRVNDRGPFHPGASSTSYAAAYKPVTPIRVQANVEVALVLPEDVALVHPARPIPPVRKGQVAAVVVHRAARRRPWFSGGGPCRGPACRCSPSCRGERSARRGACRRCHGRRRRRQTKRAPGLPAGLPAAGVLSVAAQCGVLQGLRRERAQVASRVGAGALLRG